MQVLQLVRLDEANKISLRGTKYLTLGMVQI